MKDQIVFFGVTPNLGELCAIEVFTSLKTPNARCHVIKCREIIFTEPLVLAAPSTDSTFIHVILPVSYYKEGTLLARLQKLHMRIQGPESVTMSTLSSCFKYTLTAKMTPAWNTVGEYLVYGREFLLSNIKKDAVKMDVSFSTAQYTLTLTPMSITIPQIELTDLDIAPNVLNNYNRNINGTVEERYIGSRWCNILPSNKKGQIIRVSHKLPTGKDAGFSSYKDLKRYWKNTYGYRLPETDESLFYIQVYFKPIGYKLFTYPHICVRREGFISQNPRGREVCDSFISDLRRHLKSVCGHKIKLSTTAWVPDVGLVAAQAVGSKSDCHPNTAEAGNRIRPVQISTVRHDSLSAPPATTSYQNPVSDISAGMSNSKLLTSDLVLTLPDDASVNTETAVKTIKKPNLPPFMARKKVLLNMTKRQGVFNFTKKLSTPARTLAMPEHNMTDMSSVKDASNSLKTLIAIDTIPSIRPLMAQSNTMDDQKSLKRTAASTNDCLNCTSHEYPAKKAKRSAHSDIITLAAQNQLSKANVSSLSSWLQARGIKVTSKDKKQDLIDKVSKSLHTEA